MRTLRWTALLAVLLLASMARTALAQFYSQHNLVSDGAIAADLVDPDLVNAWGLAAGPTTPWWVSNNGTATSTLYDGTGAKRSLVVSVPGAPTGVVFNGGSGFVVQQGGASGPARFIFASEDGTISGWNPGVPPPPTSTQAIVAVDNSATGAVYKGLALASTAGGDFLYASNFHAGTVDIFDSGFHQVNAPGAFVDPRLPKGYAPFGIHDIGGVIVVTYALQDADKHDDVAGMGHGFVDAYDTAGHLLRRIASRGTLNSPWGVTLAPATFGKFGNDLLIGNFGDGRIHAFGLPRGHDDEAFEPRGTMLSADGSVLSIDGLWGLAFGNGAAAGPTDKLFFTAGPFDESHGLFGSIVPAAAPPGRDKHDRGDDGH